MNGSGAKFTQGECILYHELKLEVLDCSQYVRQILREIKNRV